MGPARHNASIVPPTRAQAKQRGEVEQTPVVSSAHLWNRKRRVFVYASECVCKRVSARVHVCQCFCVQPVRVDCISLHRSGRLACGGQFGAHLSRVRGCPVGQFIRLSRWRIENGAQRQSRARINKVHTQQVLLSDHTFAPHLEEEEVAVLLEKSSALRRKKKRERKRKAKGGGELSSNVSQACGSVN